MANCLGRRRPLLLTLLIILIGDIMQCSAWGQIPVVYVGR